MQLSISDIKDMGILIPVQRNDQVHLIDSPGFHDIYRNDFRVLGAIASYC